MQAHRELAKLIERFATTDGIHETAIPRVAVIRASHPSEPVHGVYKPTVCILAQGAKRVLLGDQVFVYDAECYLVASMDLPVAGQVIEATPETPYLCFKLEIDPAGISALLLELGSAEAAVQPLGPGIGLSRVTPELMDATLRLMRLLDHPADIPFLAPAIEREILYRMLQGEQGPRLRQIGLADSRVQQVNRAIAWIRRNYRETCRIESLAAEARMSPSALHQHFKAVTAMSPLQFQKQLRLQEARQLILGHGMDAASAGFTVGYESPSQFSREYSRLFGAPPLRDVARLKAQPDQAMVA
jgi:AraC-like DNA-binding protein